VHASTHDGIRLSRAKAFPFKHNDHEHLENRLKTSSTQGDRFICIESIYSTDGAKAPLSEICRLARKYEAHLIVDEAHAVGACGPNGRGLVAEQNLSSYGRDGAILQMKSLSRFSVFIGPPKLISALTKNL